ncbi:MAG: bifunctional (p)ppGpp synthetase/guanosine-3',5'-bis(diphosphate) 3'-pyrophosphohydrolase [Bacilli bacterium]|nr:bifunctional (p)ppGpp synthetase/guanosine-3',5'-bis(diphosphate) 3'-pyrophosphohydrolase [Bacilli bacterium]
MDYKSLETYNSLLVDDFIGLLRTCVLCHRYTNDEIDMICKAHKIALEKHKGVFRKSGEPYITHPINVAYLLVIYGFDAKSVIAGLLHDTVEDTSYTLDDIKRDFGSDVAILVDGVTKMTDAKFLSTEEKQKENHKKILESMLIDARIVAIKLCDRLHNMITLRYMSDEKTKEKSLETREFYVPLSLSFGMYKIKDELEDLSLFYLENDLYNKYQEERKRIKNEYVNFYKNLANEVKYKLEKDNVYMNYDYKIKNVGGIVRELKNGKDISEIRDLVAVRMILEKLEDCYKTLGVVNSISTYVPKTFVDYIANPKYNGYRSINENVIYDDKGIQVRIRTEDMNRKNALGVISNWNSNTQEVVRQMSKALIDLEKRDLSTDQFIDEAKESFLHMKGD